TRLLTSIITPSLHDALPISGFDSFLMMQPSAEFHSQGYYESWNRQYVLEWNNRHRNPFRYGDFYQTEIHYDPHEDYGLELNYQRSEEHTSELQSREKLVCRL